MLCWGVCTTKTWEMPLIPAKSDACMSTSWSLGNLFGRLCPDALIRTLQLKEITLTENTRPSKVAGVERRASNPASEKLLC